MPRMRTAAGVLAIILAEDPNTEITLHYIRGLIATNKVPVTPVGVKKLVDADAVMSYIAAGEAPAAPVLVDGPGQIRRVQV